MRRLRDTPHAVDRATAHGLTVEPLRYGVSMPCPFACGNEIILEDKPLVGLTIVGGACLGCGAELVEIAERLLADPSVNRDLPASQAVTTRRLWLKPLSSINRRQAVMLLPELLIPIGTVSVIAGQQGIGKGTIITRCAARLSGDGYATIFLSEEDSAEAVIKPRVEAAGGDTDQIYIVQALRDDDRGGVLVPRDTYELGELAAEANTRLIVIDPWTNHVNGMDVDKGTIRQALMPLRYLAEQHNLVVVLSAHPVKSAGRGHPLDEIAHASAVTQIARSAYWVTLDPDHGSNPRENQHRLVAHVKNNTTRIGDTLRFRLDEVFLPAAGGEPEMRIVAAREDGTSMLDYAGIRRLEQRNHQASADTAGAKCATWLCEFLADGPQESRVVKEAGVVAGFSKRTIERAFKGVGGVSQQKIGAPSVWSITIAAPTATPHTHGGATGAAKEESQQGALPASGHEAHAAPAAPTLLHGAALGAAEIESAPIASSAPEPDGAPERRWPQEDGGW